MNTLVIGSKGQVARHLKAILPAHYSNNLFLDLLQPTSIESFFWGFEADIVVMPAAIVGGIEFQGSNNIFTTNINMVMNLLQSKAFNSRKRQIIFISSTCAFPDIENFSEDDLFVAPPHPSNTYYANYKRVAELLFNNSIHNCITLYPSNLIGEQCIIDVNYTRTYNLHFIDALPIKLKKKEFNFLGTGTEFRQFLSTNDLARFIKLLVEELHDPTKWRTTNYIIGPETHYIISYVVNLYKHLFGIKYPIVFNGELSGPKIKFGRTDKLRKEYPNFQIEHSLETIINNLKYLKVLIDQ